MLFNSVTFLVFISVFLVLYFQLGKRNKIILSLIGSYVFYGWWDYRFLALIFASTVVDYFIGIAMEKENEDQKRKRLLTMSVVFNLGMLAVFKYFNFFIESFSFAMDSIGFATSTHSLKIILPVGISFYTFQTMSYTIDIYRKNLAHEKDFITFATFVAFFPQLVAGPIVRASTLLPQLHREHRWNWDRFYLGLGQILLGFFKKVVVADSIAVIVDKVFEMPFGHSSLGVIIGVVFYAFQIYCDFSGYSDIAIGIARIMGYDFPMNFNMPYFSKGFSEFWKRWHISLSSWLQDYLYIFTLGGNRRGKYRTYYNLMMTMLWGGLWHGAAWTFVFWGFLHGIYLIIQRLLGPVDDFFAKFTPSFIINAFKMTSVFVLVCLAWIFFRSPDFSNALDVIERISMFEGMTMGTVKFRFVVMKGLLVIGLLVIGEYIATRINVEKLVLNSPFFRYSAFALLGWAIAFLGTFGGGQFIYFQF